MAENAGRPPQYQRVASNPPGGANPGSHPPPYGAVNNLNASEASRPGVAISRNEINTAMNKLHQNYQNAKIMSWMLGFLCFPGLLCCSLYAFSKAKKGLQAASEGNYLTAVENSYQANFCNKMAFAIAVFLQIVLFGGFITFLSLYAATPKY